MAAPKKTTRSGTAQNTGKGTATQRQKAGSKTTAKRGQGKQGASRQRSRATQAKAKEQNSWMRREVKNWIVFLFLLLVTLGVYLHTSMGIFGKALGGLFLGLFGISAYLLPLFSLMISGIALFQPVSRKFWVKLGTGYVMLILVSALCHIVNGEQLKTAADMYRKATAATGGVVGGGVGLGLMSLLGKTGAIVVIVFLFIIGLIIVTERSMVKGMRHAAVEAKKTSQHMQQMAAERSMELAQRREERLAQERLREEEEQAWSRRYASEAAEAETGFLDLGQPEETGNRQIIIRGIKPDPEAQAKAEGRKISPIGRKKPMKGGSVDIPLLSNDPLAAGGVFLKKKRRFEAKKAQAEEAAPLETAAEETAPNSAVSEQSKRKDTPEIVIEGRHVIEPETRGESGDDWNHLMEQADSMNDALMQVYGDLEAEKETETVVKELGKAPESEIERSLPDAESVPMPNEEVDVEALSKVISTEKIFATEEFPTGQSDPNEWAERANKKHSDYQNPPKKPGPSGKYEPPSVEILQKGPEDTGVDTKEELLRSAKVLEDALKSFGVEAKVIQVNKGPAVTRFELQPSLGVKVSRIQNLNDDIALNLAASSVRIEAPIPGKSAVGIEIPNKEISMVTLRDVIDSDTFRNAPSKLTFSLGKDIDGDVRVADIAKMPHMLIAGATGSGKSVCVNSMIVSLIYKADPNEVKLILIDPKVVELSVYNGIPHLLLPVVTDPKKASATLNWAVQEMERRYKKFSELNVRDLKGYNNAIEDLADESTKKMPQIVIVIDELADLMMTASKEVEASICRIAQKARAAGMHLVIATQRPSVDVITGLIKANIPSRLAFAVSSAIDSRTILDAAGAERLMGRGDMLFAPVGTNKAVRIQGTFVSDKEVEAVVEAVRLQGIQYDSDLMEELQREGTSGGSGGIENEIDEYLEDAVKFVVDKQRASISMLQRAFRIGFNRAARLMDMLYARGVVGPDEGSKPRQVLMSKEEWENDEFSH